MNKRIVLRKGEGDPPKKRRKTTNKVRSKSSLPDDKDRLNLQIDRSLKTWIQDYARRKHTSLTQLITDHFVELKEREEGDGVEQI